MFEVDNNGIIKFKAKCQLLKNGPFLKKIEALIVDTVSPTCYTHFNQ
ncbi:hypothetical protein HMPREF0519_1292 [Lentilactobacillus hilgardii DSM 20176 = ATCC 8290]|uniref:Uncharacterized protein n=1 Tax=Lentilactobacillus hilgardii (strain ATCC 8290 / DSM 20176 / CCUG 30140 / JCM 1155 / KCTC 3500 / NBRC 15886 / NCIMB 8040 / NRRL B-1843 / 9) TaxID=1423757 RepID=C0XJ81_LENH9|nr:hypothetical protein HMPREF0519_1292 [Lentilactobacillus hilgardii DSM 20176 = ATCC 8290]